MQEIARGYYQFRFMDFEGEKSYTFDYLSHET